MTMPSTIQVHTCPKCTYTAILSPGTQKPMLLMVHCDSMNVTDSATPFQSDQVD